MNYSIQVPIFTCLLSLLGSLYCDNAHKTKKVALLSKLGHGVLYISVLCTLLDALIYYV